MHIVVVYSVFQTFRQSTLASTYFTSFYRSIHVLYTEIHKEIKLLDGMNGIDNIPCKTDLNPNRRLTALKGTIRWINVEMKFRRTSRRFFNYISTLFQCQMPAGI